MWLILLKVLEPMLGPVLSALGVTLNDYLARTRAEQTQRNLGAVETTSTINRESADAERRASEEAVNRPGVGTVVSGMERGDKF